MYHSVVAMKRDACSDNRIPNVDQKVDIELTVERTLINATETSW